MEGENEDELPAEPPPPTLDGPEARAEVLKAWADRLIAKQLWVLHAPTLTVGPARNFYDGVENKYRSTVNGQEVPAAVLELETGHGFVADPEKFVELDAPAVRFYVGIQQGLAGLVRVAATGAAGAGVGQEAGFALVVSALRAQLAALEVAKPSGEVMG